MTIIYVLDLQYIEKKERQKVREKEIYMKVVQDLKILIF